MHQSRAVTAFGAVGMPFRFEAVRRRPARENIMRQAANLKDLELPMLLPGIKFNTSPERLSIPPMQLASFNGESSEQFGDVLSG